MGMGMHDLNGLSPKVSVSTISTYILPTVMYGLDAMELSTADYRELHTFQRKLLCQVQHLPKATAVPGMAGFGQGGLNQRFKPGLNLVSSRVSHLLQTWFKPGLSKLGLNQVLLEINLV